MTAPVAALGRAAAPASSRARGRAALGFMPAAWPLLALFSCYGIWWAGGIAYLVPPLLAIPLIAHLVVTKRLVVPRGFGLWLLFFVWVLLSATQLEKASHYIAWSWRLSLWIAAIALFLYVLNQPRERLPTRNVVGPILFFWGTTVVGGYLGLLLGQRRLWTPARLFVDDDWLDIDFIYNTIFPRFAQVQDWLGYPLPRPTAPFTFTNEWGANVAILIPVVIAAWPTLTGGTRRLVGMLAVASVAPIIISANRGLWVTTIGTLVYATLRLTYRRDPRATRRLFVGVVVVAGLIFLTPLGSVVTDRLENDHSNSARSTIYIQAIDEVTDRPVLGFGSPRENPLDPDLPPVGTHGTFWLVLFSHGVPGVVFFAGALVSLCWRTAWTSDRQLFWLHCAVVAGTLMIPFYDLLPVPIFVLVTAAALVLRDTSTSTTAAPA